MIQSKVMIIGRVVRMVGSMVYVRSGDAVDAYNTNYYRVVEGR